MLRRMRDIQDRTEPAGAGRTRVTRREDFVEARRWTPRPWR
jgi:hypothetical protein